MRLKGRVALVTGAGSGIGAATALRCVSEGAKVCIMDVDGESLKDTARLAAPGEVVTYTGDVSKREDVMRTVETTLALEGRLDILVNCAGIDPSGPGVDDDPVMWNKTLEINLTGPHLTMKAAIPHMIRGRGGSIVNIASLSAIRFIAGRAAYTASKGGLVSLSQAIAVEYGPVRIRCNVICPGAIRTPMFENKTRPVSEMLGRDPEWVFEKFTSFSPLRRIGRPEEIAAICSFLASDDSSLLTGAVIVADGGTSLIDANGAAMSTIIPDRRS
jgi:meso-butanediol dehydrogenase / (S,S)-butanediol dehydrogenase / diacetyl reductase